MEDTLRMIGALLVVGLLLAAAYCWVFGTIRAVRWYRRTWKQKRSDADCESSPHWFDRFLFGHFAILSNPEALTEDGLVARGKTIAAFRTLGIGVLLVVIVVLIEAYIGIVET